MSVQFVYGRPGAVMNEYLDQQAAQVAQRDPTASVYVVTRRQYTYGTEAEISDMDGLAGHMGLQVTSLEGISRDILQSVYGGALEYVDLAGKSMLIRRILDERRDELLAFRSISSDSTLPSDIARQLVTFKCMDIRPEDLTAYAKANPEKLRIHDLALIYADLAVEMEGSIDSEDMVNIAIEHLEDAWFLKDALVIMRGFDEWSLQQIRFAESLIAAAERVIIEMPRVPEGQPDLPLYGACLQAGARLLPAAERTGVDFFTVDESSAQCPEDIQEAAKHLFSYDKRQKIGFEHMSLTENADAEEEIRRVASEIVRLHQEEGVAFKDMAIVWGETSEYEPLVRRIFSEANIPYFTGEKKTLAESNLAEFVLTAAELTKGPLSKDALLAHAATGFTALNELEYSVLSNYAYSYVSWGSQFEKEFTLPEAKKREFKDSLRIAEEARVKLMKPILEDLRPKGRKTAGDTLEALEKYVRRLLTEERIEAKAERMDTAYEQVSFMEQSAKTILTIIGQAKDLLGDLPIEAHDLRRVLRAGFEAVRLSLVPAALDEVQAGPLMNTFIRKVHALFVVGVNDEVLPRFNEPMNDVLSPVEWNALLEALYGYTLPTSAEAQKFRIYRVMYQVTGHLYWSWQTGGETKPSVLISYLQDLRRPEPEEETPSQERFLSLKQNAYDLVVRQIRSAADGGPQPDAALAACVLFDPTFLPRTDQLEINLTKANKAIAAAPALPNTRFSATRLQTFGNCPYKHFLSYQLGAWEPPSTVIDHRITGTFMHGVLEGIVNQTQERGQRRWSDYSADEFAQLVGENIEREVTDQIGLEPLPRNAARIEALRPRIIEAAEMIRGQQAHGLLTPILAETEFNISLPEATVHGFIDRMDMIEWAGRRYFSIVDYKSSAHDVNLAALLQGTDVQVILYLLALDQMIRSGTVLPMGAADFPFHPGDLISGAGFLNLVPQLKEKSPENLFAAYGMKGLLTVSPDLASVLYGCSSKELLGFSGQLTSDGSYNKRTTAWRAFSSGPASNDNAQLQALLHCGGDIVRSATERSLKGDNVISPARLTGGVLACGFCPYRSICRFEEEEMGRQVRNLPPGDNARLKEQLLEKYGE